MACLDTNILIEILRGNQLAVEKVKDLMKSQAIGISAVSAYELLFGCYFYRPNEIKIVKELIDSVEVFVFDQRCADISGLIRSESMRAGKTLQVFDCMIAGTAWTYKEPLLTTDKGFLEINSLNIPLIDKTLKIDLMII